MEAKKIEVIKDWPKSKSICNIQVFLGFANFYWQFIQGFSRIAAPFISMLKTTRLPDKPVLSRNNGSRSASSKNDNSKPASGKNNGNGEVNKFSVGRNSLEHVKKLGKSFKSENLSKSGQLKSDKLFKFQRLSKIRKLFKSQKLAQSRKKLSKSENLSNFDAKKNGPSFLNPDARTAFNHLRWAFIKALIL